MDLFNQEKVTNILAKDGNAQYYGPIMSSDESRDCYKYLLEEIAWKQDEVIMFGKRIITKRKVAWYGSLPFEYTYSKIKRKAIIWSNQLLDLKSIVEQVSGESYNSCLLNLYHSGDEGMGWHSDNEKELLENGAIASVSFGAERKFVFKHKETKETQSIILQNGSLLVMKGLTQKKWLHRLPPTKKVKVPRINLTFRTIVG